MRWWPRRLTATALGTRSISVDRLTAANNLAILLAVGALETLPLLAWLTVGATFQANDPWETALPLWYLFAVVLLASGFGVLFRFRVAHRLALTLLLAVGWLLSLLVALRVSPAAYARVAVGDPLTWLGVVAHDLVSSSSHPRDDLGVMALVVYLWWRGLRVGRKRIDFDRLYRWFRVGLAAIIAAIVIAAAAGPLREALAGRLVLLLPIDVGIGLMALALLRVAHVTARRAARTEGEAHGGEGPLAQTPWLLMALSLAVTVVGGSLLLAAVFSYSALQALGRVLRPIVHPLTILVDWLINGLAIALYYVLSPLFRYLQPLLDKLARRPPRPQLPVNPAASSHAQPIPSAWNAAAHLTLVILLVLVMMYIVWSVLRSVAHRRTPTDGEETRESLDVGRLLREQLRGLLRRRRRAEPPATEELASASVRRLYRDALRAALRAGRGRSSVETPDEYHRRLARAATGASSAAQGDTLPVEELARLTALYDRARYGQAAEREEDQQGARAQSQRLSDWFARHRVGATGRG